MWHLATRPAARDDRGMATPPPELTGPTKALSDASRTLFRYANRYAMVPVHRAGLAAWLGNPLTGWQCLLATTGRRSGLRRYTPVGYLVAEGAAWIMAGYGTETLWYLNILADPRVELLLPDRPPFAALAAVETDPAVRSRILPALSRSMALPASMIGCFPPTAHRRANPRLHVLGPAPPDHAGGRHGPRARAGRSRRPRMDLAPGAGAWCDPRRAANHRPVHPELNRSVRRR